ncbi:MAG: hypothetical protein Q8M31_21810 [Beijerinckiaceae bacterium]|nr:hypothetical protein [Beijerinckiaceae bacterium]
MADDLRSLVQRTTCAAITEFELTQGAIAANIVAEGYVLGAVAFLKSARGKREAYRIVQRISDELAEAVIEQKG